MTTPHFPSRSKTLEIVQKERSRKEWAEEADERFVFFLVGCIRLCHCVLIVNGCAFLAVGRHIHQRMVCHLSRFDQQVRRHGQVAI